MLWKERSHDSFVEKIKPQPANIKPNLLIRVNVVTHFLCQEEERRKETEMNETIP